MTCRSCCRPSASALWWINCQTWMLVSSDMTVPRAMLVLSFIGHAYVYQTWWSGAATRLPPVLARPWHAVASRLRLPPVLSYAAYALDNWRRLDPGGPIALGSRRTRRLP